MVSIDSTYSDIFEHRSDGDCGPNTGETVKAGGEQRKRATVVVVLVAVVVYEGDEYHPSRCLATMRGKQWCCGRNEEKKP